MKIKRNVAEQLISSLENQDILILIGARQVGKTYLMNQLEAVLRSRQKRFKYYNLELIEDSRFFGQDLNELYKQITKDVDYLFIDEFQYFENASKFFKAIYDDRKNKIKIIASGSSSLEMHKHLKESLAGRKEKIIIYPLQFNEAEQNKVSFNSYLNYGGLPGVIKRKTAEEKINHLNEILETYILKDIKSLIREENISAFNRLIYLLADYQGQQVATSPLANELRIDEKTVTRYLDILEQTFVIYPLHSFSGNLSNELKKSKKYYLYDSGIRNSILNDFSKLEERKDKGKILETYVHNYLKTNAPANAEIRFWRTRTKDEIDLVYLRNRKPNIIEAKSKYKRPEVPAAFKKFLTAYPKTEKCFVVNETLEDEIIYKDHIIRFVRHDKLEKDLEFNRLLETGIEE